MTEVGDIIIDGGNEGGGYVGTIDIIGPRKKLNDDGTASVRWLTHGHPDSGLEWSFNSVANRNAKSIWHLIDVIATVSDNGIVVTPVLRGSRFPSHRMWINTSLHSNITQGLMVNLWEELHPLPKLQLANLLAVPATSLNGFVTEQENGDYVIQATPNILIPVEGSWNPDED